MRSHAFRKIAAIVLVASGAFSLSARAGTYTANWLGGTGIWEQDGVTNWSTIAYPNNGHFTFVAGNPFPDNSPLYDVVINNPLPCTLGISVGVQLVSVGNGATLNLLNNVQLNTAGTFTTDGLVTLNSTNAGTHLRVGNGSGVGATGVISMSDSSQNFISGSGSHGDTFTIASGGVISGAGQLNIGFFGGTQFLLNYVNQGLIDANQAVNALNIGLDDSVNANMTNTGTLRASSSGTLRFRNLGATGTVNNSGGVIEATGSGKVRIAAGITVNGGTISTSGSGTIHGDYPGGGGGTLNNVTNTGAVVVDDQESIGIAGTFTNNGTVSLNSLGNGATLRVANGTTLAGNGVVSLSNNGSNYIMGVNSGDTFTIASGATIQGAGTISPGFSGGSNMLKINNGGLIKANILGAGLGIRVEDGNNTPLANTGTLRASNGGSLTIYTFGTGTLTNNGGTIQSQTGSTVTGLNNLAFVQNSGTIDLAGGNMNFANGVTLNGGQMKGTATFTGPIGVNANAILQGGNGTVGTTLSVAGTVSLNDNSIIELTLGPSATHSTLARTGGGTWTFDSNQAFSFLDNGATQGTFYNNIITGLNANPGTTAMWTIVNPGWTGVFSYDGANIDLNVTSIAAVPEPSTWAMGLLGTFGLLAIQRFRSRSLR